MGRPPEPDARTHAVMVRLNDQEHAALTKLVELRNEELAGQGVTIKPPDVLRWLVARELAARMATKKGAKR